MSHRTVHVCMVAAAVLCAAAPSPASAQGAPPSDTSQVTPAPPAAGLPVFATLGLGYGMRSDDCATCATPENTDSFTGHLSLGKTLGHGVGLGVGVSVWRRGHPGPAGPADSTGVPTATTLGNMLGNASVLVSYQVWRVWVQAGGGLALGSQDLAPSTPDGAITTASGLGIGYTVGGGFSIPLAGPMALAVFANLNAGSYDLTSPVAVVARDAEHRYLEVGVGLTLR